MILTARAVAVSVTPHWSEATMWGRLNAPNHPQPWSGCRPNRRAIVPDVVLASQVEAIRNTIASRTKRKFVVLASQVQAIRNSLDGIRRKHFCCISLSKQGHPQHYNADYIEQLLY